MSMYSGKLSMFAVLCLCVTSCAQGSASDGDMADETGAASAADVATNHVTSNRVSAELQHEITQALVGCFAVGADLVGGGDVAGARAVLPACFSSDMTSEAILPPAYAALAFATSGGTDGWLQVANGIYRQFGFTRVQHLITNVVVHRTGPNTAIVKSDALAVHVYPDEHTFNATLKFEDRFREINGQWKITHRTMTVTSLTQAAAWQP